MKLMFLVLGLSVLMFSPVRAQEKYEGQPQGKFCPVCGPEEKMEELILSYKYKGQKYSFCSRDCLKAFKKNPEQYTK